MAKCHDREIYMKDGKKFTHCILHTFVDIEWWMLSQITLVYNLRSQYISNDLPRK